MCCGPARRTQARQPATRIANGKPRALGEKPRAGDDVGFLAVFALFLQGRSDGRTPLDACSRRRFPVVFRRRPGEAAGETRERLAGCDGMPERSAGTKPSPSFPPRCAVVGGRSLNCSRGAFSSRSRERAATSLTSLGPDCSRAALRMRPTVIRLSADPCHAVVVLEREYITGKGDST